MAVNSLHSPRQKMINVMYLVFIAMLALNVSVDVLDSFKVVDDSLENSSTTLLRRNELIMDELADYNTRNPEKSGEWHAKGMSIRSASDSLGNYIEELKLMMVREADGKRASLNNIKNKDNLDAASVVMLSPINGEGKKLREAINSYRDRLIDLVTDPARKAIIERNLSTEPLTANKSWEASLFEQMPLAAAITMLTKIEYDVRASEGEALTNILNNVDGGDFRINHLNAYLIPESDIVMRGDSYNARVILAAEDTTQSPTVFVNGDMLDNGKRGHLSVPTNATGNFPVEGYLEMSDNDGLITQHPFSGSYTVIEPMASIAPVLTNVLYAGIDNELSISVPGITQENVQASMTNGAITRKGSVWVARPSTVGQETTITVTARNAEGNSRQVAAHQFRVRPLPDPTPYIEYDDAGGNKVVFKGGGLPKGVLMGSQGIKAAIDDDILSVPFEVNSFRTVFFDSMGNAIPEVSDNNKFSERQKEQIRRLPRGSYFYISGVKATGPDGLEREIAVMEVRIQ